MCLVYITGTVHVHGTNPALRVYQMALVWSALSSLISTSRWSDHCCSPLCDTDFLCSFPWPFRTWGQERVAFWKALSVESIGVWVTQWWLFVCLFAPLWNGVMVPTHKLVWGINEVSHIRPLAQRKHLKNNSHCCFPGSWVSMQPTSWHWLLPLWFLLTWVLWRVACRPQRILWAF